MRNVFEKIQELEDIPSYSKHEQLVLGIINALDEKLVQKGDMLPSVNNMIKELGFARETIVRGYKELIARGIIESKNRLGYFITNNDTGQTLKIALLMYAFDAFQETFYKTFLSELGPNVHLDTYFHHNNIDIFETIVSDIRGKYGMYVIAPIPHPKTAGILQTLPMNKFLMIDRFEPMEGDFSHITQEFGQSTYKALTQLSGAIKKFGEIIYFHHPGSAEPIEILTAFKKFIRDHKLKGSIKTEYVAGSIEKGKVYYTIHNTELWMMLKDCRAKNLKPGKEVGILSHNDDVVKEIISDGITTYSTDFKLMAEKAASFVLTRKKIRETIPTILIKRNSL
jgi:DNA-binding transcriptional regulator YhcF (GntR family)